METFSTLSFAEQLQVKTTSEMASLLMTQSQLASVSLRSPFSISTGKTSIFSTRFSSSYSADAETGSTSSLRRSYSSLEKVLKTCEGQHIRRLQMTLNGRTIFETFTQCARDDVYVCKSYYHGYEKSPSQEQRTPRIPKISKKWIWS